MLLCVWVSFFFSVSVFFSLTLELEIVSPFSSEQKGACASCVMFNDFCFHFRLCFLSFCVKNQLREHISSVFLPRFLRRIVLSLEGRAKGKYLFLLERIFREKEQGNKSSDRNAFPFNVMLDQIATH